MGKEKYLNRLIGKKLMSVSISTNTIVAINGKNEKKNSDKFTLSNVLNFDDYNLHIYNPITIEPSNKELNDLIGDIVVNTDERENDAEILFDSGCKLLVNMQAEAYYDPEAMSLYGPNSFFVVWN